MCSGPFRSDEAALLGTVRAWLALRIPKEEPAAFLRVPLADRGVCAGVQQALPRSELRRQLWLGQQGSPNPNLAGLGELLRTRQLLARQLGHRSHAHRYLANKVLDSPERVQTFLESCSRALKPSVEKELQGLRAAGCQGELWPWEVTYWKEQRQGGGPSPGQELSGFLSLPACLSGLALVSERLFGLVLQEEPLGPAESWVRGQGRVHKLQVWRGSEAVGTVYLDLFARKGKFSGPAHFTLRCGTTGTAPGLPQLPVVALVASLPFHSSGPGPLLGLGQVEALHHEWGHALHSLLARTGFQHLAGTRGGPDLVEVPSHLFEHFARCPSVLPLWARHHHTGEPPSPGLVKAALEEKKAFRALEMQNQLLYSLADQFVFGPEMGDLTSLTPQQVFLRALHGVCEQQELFTQLPLVPLTKEETARFLRTDGPCGPVKLPAMNLLTHEHFINYGGGYYSYIFSRMYAAQIWRKHFEADPLNKAAGDTLLSKMLVFGAAKDSAEILNDIAGELDPNVLLDC